MGIFSTVHIKNIQAGPMRKDGTVEYRDCVIDVWEHPERIKAATSLIAFIVATLLTILVTCIFYKLGARGGDLVLFVSYFVTIMVAIIVHSLR